LLRHHDRAWQSFWPRVQLVALPDIHAYAGVAAAQLADHALECQRGDQWLRVAAAALPGNGLNDFADALHRLLPSANLHK
jgi:hypothetical protein